jgi:transaldolase
MELISQIKQMFVNYDIHTEIIVTSIRNPIHVPETALIGADIANIPYKANGQVLKHPLTDRVIEQFLTDWEKVKGR